MTRRICTLTASAALGAALMSCAAHRGGETDYSVWDGRRADRDARIIAALDAGRFAQALSIADSILSEGDRDSRVLGQRAQALAGSGRGGEAVPVFEEAILSDYENCDNHLNFAVLLLRLGLSGRAITELQVATRFCPAARMPLIHRNLAVAYLDMERPDKALDQVNTGLEYGTDDPYLQGLRGMLIVETNPVEAESLLVRSLRSNGLSLDFLYRFGIMLLGENRNDEAVSALERVSAGRPDDMEVQLNYAEALYRARRDGDAERLLLGLGRRGAGERADRMLAKLYFRAERYGEALALYRGLEQSPEIIDRVAMCLHGMGRLEEAEEWSRRAVDARPDWAVGLINLAVILAARGELDEARSLLVRALEIEPENATARINLDTLDGMIGEGRP